MQTVPRPPFRHRSGGASSRRRSLAARVRGLAAAAAAVAGLALALAPLTPSSASPTGQLIELPGATPPSPASFGATVLGPAKPSQTVSVQLYFQPTGPAELAALASAVSTPGDSLYHHFLTVPQFAARFGPSNGVVGPVDEYLRSKGLSAGPLSANRLSQDVTGTVGQYQAAFGTSLLRLRAANGASVIGSAAGPRLPADLVGSVAFVDGLDPWALARSNLVRFPVRDMGERSRLTEESPLQGTRSLRGQATSECSGMAQAGLTPAQLDTAYRLSGFGSAGEQGLGETIGLIEYALPDTPAVRAYEACTGASLSIDYDPTSSPPTTTIDEVAADIEIVAALAPKATVVVYESSQQGTGLAPWDLAVSGSAAGGLPEVISSSWTSCEPDTGMGNAYYQAEEALFEEAATQGQTVLAASGDDGSEGCFDQTKSKALAVSDPASAPFVTAVGGTASNTVAGAQYIWNSHDAASQGCLGTGCPGGASGGGASTVWPRPGYQPATLPQSPVCTQGAQGCREVPDVSAIAGDPYALYCTPSICGGGNWISFGGTSVAAPSWGAAVLLSESTCSGKIGFLNPLLYSEPGALTGPITSGNNDFTGTHAGLYPASSSGGYSMAGGLGYLGGADLSSGALCGPNGGTGPGSGPGGPGGNGSPGPTTSTTNPAPGSPRSTGPAPTPPPAAACVKPQNEPVKGDPVALAATEDDNACAGYLIVTQKGQVTAFGGAITYGSVSRRQLKAPVVGIAVAPGSEGYWVLSSDGQVFAFGDAKLYGAGGDLHMSAPAVGLYTTPDGKGYWVVARDGSVSAFGDAKFYGSMTGQHLNEPIVAIAARPAGDGYWLVAADGGVFAFGGARYHGSTAAKPLTSPVVGFTVDPSGDGYVVVAANGATFPFGTASYGPYRGTGANAPPYPVVDMAPAVDGKGYYLLDSAGQVYTYGDAIFEGNATG